MLQNILYFFIISFFCLAWGLPFFFLFQHFEKKVILSIEKLIFIFFIGLCVLAVISSWLSLIAPVQFRWLLILTALLLIPEYVWYSKLNTKLFDFGSIKKLHIIELAFLFSCILLFFVLGSAKPVMEDTDLYHIQSIKWAHEYGTVPGLANLYLRYGFYSTWFQLISFFYIPFPHQNFLYLNITLCIWTLLFLFYQYKAHTFNHRDSKQLSIYYFLLLLYMLFEWDLFRISASSTSYDFVITCLCTIAIHCIIKQLFQNQTYFYKYALLLLLCVAPFFKLTGFLDSFLLLIYFIQIKFKRNQLVFGCFIFACGLIPLIYKNYLQTGYPFYPYTLFHFIKPSWQVPLAMVGRFNQYITLSNHYINQAVPSQAWINNSNFSYVHNWFLHLTKPDQFIICLSLLGAPLSWIVYKKLYPEHFKKILLLQLSCYCMLAVWLFASPDTRFAFGLLLFTAFFPVSALLIKFWRTWMFYTGFAAATVFIIPYIYNSWPDKFRTAYLLQPAAIDIPPGKTVLLNGVYYHIPEKINNNWNQRCYNTPLPCIYERNPYLQPRGKSIKDGFFMKPYPDSSFVTNYYY